LAGKLAAEIADIAHQYSADNDLLPSGLSSKQAINSIINNISKGNITVTGSVIHELM
jgi:hypothetical protein